MKADLGLIRKLLGKKPKLVRYTSDPPRAWRVWRLKGIKEKDPKLFSVTLDFPWEGPVVKAHAKPQEGLQSVGIYSWREKLELKHFLHDATYLAGDGLVAGTLDLTYGRVIKCTLGYRAEQVVLASIDLKHFPCITSAPWWKFYFPEICKEPVAYWCELKSIHPNFGMLKTRPFCKKHADLTLPHMAVEEIAAALEDRYQCEVII